MKRFKVVQDVYRNWGVLDTVHGEFAEWGSYDGDSFWFEALIWATDLNAGTAEIDELFWSTYRDR